MMSCHRYFDGITWPQWTTPRRPRRFRFLTLVPRYVRRCGCFLSNPGWVMDWWFEFNQETNRKKKYCILRNMWKMRIAEQHLHLFFVCKLPSRRWKKATLHKMCPNWTCLPGWFKNWKLQKWFQQTAGFLNPTTPPRLPAALPPQNYADQNCRIHLPKADCFFWHRKNVTSFPWSHDPFSKRLRLLYGKRRTFGLLWLMELGFCGKIEPWIA